MKKNFIGKSLRWIEIPEKNAFQNRRAAQKDMMAGIWDFEGIPP